VVDIHDAVRVAPLIEHLEVEAPRCREKRLTAADDHESKHTWYSSIGPALALHSLVRQWSLPVHRRFSCVGQRDMVG
jgi:hypothetical protein